MWKRIRGYFGNKISESEPQCEICMQKLTKKNATQLCNCQHAYCHQCVTQFVDSKIKSYELIKCLDQKCTSQLNQKGQFYQKLPKEKKDKYQKIKRFYFVSKNPTFKLCPKQTCTGLINIKDKPCMCNVCLQKYCPKCLYKQHWGWCQKQSIIHLQNDLNFIQCSHCNFIIEKNDGCDHITCRCGYQLCYKCGGIWKGPQHLCVRSKRFQKFRYYFVSVWDRMQPLFQISCVRNLKRQLCNVIPSLIYFNLALAVILTVLEIVYKIASVFSPFKYISIFESSEDNTQVVQVQQESGFGYQIVLFCLVFAAVYYVGRLQLKNTDRKYFVLIGAAIAGLLYILSNLLTVFYYEFIILWFLIQNIETIAIILCCVVLLYYLMKGSQYMQGIGRNWIHRQRNRR